MVEDTQASEASFERELANLERVVDLLERGDLELEEAIRQFESGTRSLKVCREALDRARRRIEVLTGSLEPPAHPPPPAGAASAPPPEEAGIRGAGPLRWREEEPSGLSLDGADRPRDARASG